jgi:hypothetical protein
MCEGGREREKREEERQKAIRKMQE